MTRARGTVLLAVLAAVTLSALAATTMLVAMDSAAEASGASLTRTQSRALAWSGVQAATAQLADQRETLLAGEPPELDAVVEVYELEDGRLGVARLVPFADGSLAQPETAKLDLNHAAREMLASLDGIDDALAGSVIEARPYSSVHDLLELDAVTPELLYGSDQPTEFTSGSARLVLTDTSRPFADLVTVHSFDPNIQTGVGDDAPDVRGRQRFNLDLPWSDRLGRALDDRFGDGTGRVVQEIMNAGYTFRRDADLIGLLRTRFNLGPREWAPILDAVATSDDEYRTGRVDLNTAPPEVLAAIPGIDSTAAQRIATERATLGDEERLTVCWIAASGIVSTDDFMRCVDHLTTRSMQWRVRIEAGTIAPDALEPVADEFGVITTDADPALDGRVVYEAVIDIASQRPRIAELIELTALDAARVAAKFEQTQNPETPFTPEPDLVLTPPDPLAALPPEDSPTDPANADQPVMTTSDDPLAPIDRRTGRWRYGGAP